MLVKEGSVLSLFGKGLSKTPKQLGSGSLRKLIWPKTKPNPSKVLQNSGLQKTRLGKGVDFVANVPKGERFRQRPVANTRRLLSFDGLPGMRRLNQGVLGAVGAYGAYETYDTNKWVNKHLDNYVKGTELVRGLSPEQVAQMRSRLLSAKRRYPLDRVARSVLPGYGASRDIVDDRAYQAVDSVVGNSFRERINPRLSNMHLAKFMEYPAESASYMWRSLVRPEEVSDWRENDYSWRHFKNPASASLTTAVDSARSYVNPPKWLESAKRLEKFADTSLKLHNTIPAKYIGQDISPGD